MLPSSSPEQFDYSSSKPQPPSCLKVNRKMSNKNIRWNETDIASHDLERGTRTKIDEPNTPFCRMGSYSDTEEGDKSQTDETIKSDAVQLMFRLNQLKDGEREESFRSHRSGSLSSSVSLNSESDSKKDFEARRKAHYNEFLTKASFNSGDEDSSNRFND